MATGFEIAGVVLASLPLIISAVEHYAQGVSTAKRFLRYRLELRSLLAELKTQESIFINTCEILLTGMIPVHRMKDFLQQPGGRLWQDASFATKLEERLQESYQGFVETINQMKAVTEELKRKLQLDSAGKPPFENASAFKETYKRLKLCLCKSDYDDLLHRFRRSNHALDRLVAQTRELEVTRAKTKRESLPNFKIMHDYAKKCYAVLRSGWRCTCPAPHTVNLRLEPRIEVSLPDEEYESDDKEGQSLKQAFHVVFCYSHHGSRNAVTSTVPWTWEEADIHLVHEEPLASISNAMSIEACQKPQVRTVKFATQAKHAVKTALDPKPNRVHVDDLCRAISSLQQPNRDMCLSLLANEYTMQKYGILIYPLRTPSPDRETWSVLSLHKIMKESSFTRRNRLQLAVTLASSVLQLHQTPWLEEDWSKDDIFFIHRTEGTMYNYPFVSRPVSTTKVPAHVPQIDDGSPTPIRNRTLFALGVILIELWYGKPIYELCSGVDSRKAEWYKVYQLADSLYEDAGESYSDAVRRCVWCDFDKRATNLQDLDFQRAVYNGVVALLKQNLDFLTKGLT